MKKIFFCFLFCLCAIIAQAKTHYIEIIGEKGDEPYQLKNCYVLGFTEKTPQFSNMIEAVNYFAELGYTLDKTYSYYRDHNSPRVHLHYIMKIEIEDK